MGQLDLNTSITLFLKTLNANIVILEAMMKGYSINSPDRSRNLSNVPANTQLITDEFIALDIFLYLQEHVENLTKALRSLVTNESIRKKIKEMTIKTVKETDIMVRYLTAKGWMSVPPMYKQIPHDVKAGISVAEAANLWDHLTLGYDNIRTTEIYLGVTHDMDFKVILTIGLEKLNKQVELLEEKLQHYGITMPKRPSKVTLTLANAEVLSDDYMYRILVNGFQGAAIKHVQSFKECVYCDKTRNVFKTLFLEEIDVIDDFYKYGKLKGWLNPAPPYGP